LKIVGKESNPPYGGLLCLIGKEKQKVKEDRVCYENRTDKNRKTIGKETVG
jgi:hypothetical protein